MPGHVNILGCDVIIRVLDRRIKSRYFYLDYLKKGSASKGEGEEKDYERDLRKEPFDFLNKKLNILNIHGRIPTEVRIAIIHCKCQALNGEVCNPNIKHLLYPSPYFKRNWGVGGQATLQIIVKAYAFLC